MRSSLLIALAIALALLAAAPVGAVSNGEGDLVVSFDGALNPVRLPRNTLAPVAVRVSGTVTSASGDAQRLPQLRRITVAINRQGRLYDRGLPVCTSSSIRAATEAVARRNCEGSIVGSGHVTVQVRLGSQPPFEVHARLLVFNGPTRGGQKLIIAQAYTHKPPGSFILTFRVEHRSGTFGTVLSTALPIATRNWAYLTHFDMTLHRVYAFRGRSRSYVSAACRAPDGFDKVLFPFARATYVFATGQQLSMSQTATCRVSAK